MDTSLNSELTEASNITVQKENITVSSSTTEINSIIKNETSPDSGLALPGLEPEACNNKYSSIFPLNNVELDTVSKKESETKDIHKSSESSLPNQKKRAASPELSSQAKQQKIDDPSDSVKPCTDLLSGQKVPEIKTENSPETEKVFSFSLFEDLVSNTFLLLCVCVLQLLYI